ncbi:M15 family metallopeptidase [Sphingomonas hylomeconis]|uniref:M15 family metallopeptidase n=1 Tax=Sphingomonas hylomeconis TaxID=1395958 RepID=UPI0021BA3CBF|nr:M15 family metallopeptidase [Sphingomonas hylomeconis]
MPEKHPVNPLFKFLVGACGWSIGLAPGLALAMTVPLCPTQNAEAGTDGRVLGHLPYGQGAEADLLPAPPGFAIGGPCRLHRAAMVDLIRLLQAADTVPGVAGTLRGVSCFRPIEYQRQVFCAQIGQGQRFANAAERARVAAPPAYSEHATGYTLDFAVRPSPDCPDVDACIIWHPAGRWLLAHARDFGFELSFPAGNAQGVSWEPWHWRWVGVSPKAPGAAAARAVFARAAAKYPAIPGVYLKPPPVVPTLPRPGFPLYWPRVPGL